MTGTAAPPRSRRDGARGLRALAELARGLRALWASFEAAPQGRRVPGTVPLALIGAVVVLGAAVFATSTGWALAFPDAQSHLTIARRIFDSLTPGFTQLGTVWLPLPNILLIPFTAWLPLWASGWSAALLGAICMAGTVGACYRIAAHVGLGRAGRLTVVLLLVTNPSFVYVHTTGLSEPVLILFLSSAAAGLASYALVSRPMSAGETMVFCGLPAACAVLSRYEGWAIVMSGALFIAIVAWRRQRGRSQRERLRLIVKSIAAFLLWPGVAAAWWLSYNFVVYGDPLEFMRGQYSAASLQAPVSESGLLAYKGHLGLTLWSYHWAIIGTVGAVTLLLAAAGLALLIVRNGLDDRALAVLVLATGWAFSLLSLYLGQTHMNNMHTLPQGWWNNRYALVSLPWLAMLAAVLVDALHGWAARARARSRPDRLRGGWGEPAAAATLALLLLALVAQGAWMLAAPAARSAVLAEGAQYLGIKDRAGTDAAAAYLREHYDGGYILMDESAAGNAILPQIGIPLREYLNRSTGELFDAALANPAGHAEWLFYTTADAPQLSSASVADLVYERLLQDPAAAVAYETVFSTGHFVIARRLGA